MGIEDQIETLAAYKRADLAPDIDAACARDRQHPRAATWPGREMLDPVGGHKRVRNAEPARVADQVFVHRVERAVMILAAHDNEATLLRHMHPDILRLRI